MTGGEKITDWCGGAHWRVDCSSLVGTTRFLSQLACHKVTVPLPGGMYEHTYHSRKKSIIGVKKQVASAREGVQWQMSMGLVLEGYARVGLGEGIGTFGGPFKEQMLHDGNRTWRAIR